MLRRTKLAAAITTATVALAGPVVVAGPAAQAATPDHSAHKPVRVVMTNAGFTLPKETRAGFVTFAVSTEDAGGHELQGVQLHKGVSLAKFTAELRLAVSNDPKQAAAGISAAERDATAVGGASVEPSTAVDVTIPLCRGTYYFFDFTQLFVPNAAITYHKLEAKGRFEGRTPAHGAEIDQVETKAGPRFVTPKAIDPDDTILVRNKADEFHEAMFQRVNRGVDNAKLTKFFNALKNGQNPGFNPFAENVSRGAAAISGGRIELIRFHAQRGHYALLCFIPDNQSGIPHAFLGMHAVVRLAESSS
ncbi:hypothetical protein [Streptacidiphilus neutrinimicus]|uniref:hypothetical protein n=1 Tax=Streptacidiphilus neutrinimicus TaxID=105420 RepID=UPI0005A87406|nr:hypothetical protein [Streptacidiphilus neutrinimicus]